jgi:prophage maintenance system killer protein
MHRCGGHDDRRSGHYVSRRWSRRLSAASRGRSSPGAGAPFEGRGNPGPEADQGGKERSRASLDLPGYGGGHMVARLGLARRCDPASPLSMTSTANQLTAPGEYSTTLEPVPVTAPPAAPRAFSPGRPAGLRIPSGMAPLPPTAILALQRAGGNSAVCRWVSSASRSRLGSARTRTLQREVGPKLPKNMLVWITISGVPANIDQEADGQGYRLRGYGDRVFTYAELGDVQPASFGEPADAGAADLASDRASRLNWRIREAEKDKDRRASLAGSPLGGGSPTGARAAVAKALANLEKTPPGEVHSKERPDVGAVAGSMLSCFEIVVSAHAFEEANGRLAIFTMYLTAAASGYQLKLPPHLVHALLLGLEGTVEVGDAAWKKVRDLAFARVCEHLVPIPARIVPRDFERSPTAQELIGLLGGMAGSKAAPKNSSEYRKVAQERAGAVGGWGNFGAEQMTKLERYLKAVPEGQRAQFEKDARAWLEGRKKQWQSFKNDEARKREDKTVTTQLDKLKRYAEQRETDRQAGPSPTSPSGTGVEASPAPAAPSPSALLSTSEVAVDPPIPTPVATVLPPLPAGEGSDPSDASHADHEQAK